MKDDQYIIETKDLLEKRLINDEVNEYDDKVK